MGTFISPDTIVPDATSVFDYNRYMFVRGNPLRYSDPTGRYSDDEIVASLKDQYGDEWVHYWDMWQQDEYWMWILHTADDFWAIWNSSTGSMGHFYRNKGNPRILIHAQKEDKQLSDFHAMTGLYQLEGANQERPVDPFIQSGYLRPLFDYYGYPSRYDEQGHLVATYAPYGYQYVGETVTLWGLGGSSPGVQAVNVPFGPPNQSSIAMPNWLAVPIGMASNFVKKLDGVAFVGDVADLVTAYETKPVVGEKIHLFTGAQPNTVLPLVPGGPQ